MPQAADLSPGPRLALVVATGTYTDAGLRRLRAPARDAADLAQVLADPGIGGFTVTTVIDQPAQQVRLAVEDFLAGRGTGDLLLLYLSCHGLLDARRRLYFAATDTRKDRLGATGVESAWVLDQLEHCRARRQVLILDSCFSGAFAPGAKGEADLGLRDRFLGQGRGRVVLTASTATEYSFEGESADPATPPGSVFTAALVQGLRTGAADTDHDGYVSVDDAYAYVFDQVQAAGTAQTPQRWLYGAEGQMLLARNPARSVIIPAPLPESLRAGLDSPHPGIRIGAVTELAVWLASGDPAREATARRHLQEVADADIPRVARTARALLDTHATAEPQEAQGQTGLQPKDWAHLAAERQPAAHPDPRARSPVAEPKLEPLHFIWILDTSTSMSGAKIQQLNFAIREAIQPMRDTASENPHAQVLVRVVTFSAGARWHLATPTPVADFKWSDVSAGGLTDMGKALTLVAEQLRIPPMTDKALPPVLMLISDGQPTDDFGSGLKTLMAEPWAKKAVRLAIAVGRDADRDVLSEFIGHAEIQPLQANNAAALVNYIKWASTAVLKAASSPASQSAGASPGGNNVPLPTLPAGSVDTNVWLAAGTRGSAALATRVAISGEFAPC